MVSERRCPRVRVDSLISVDLGRDNAGIVLDLCEGGLRIRAVGRLKKDQVVKLGFSLLGKDHRIETRGQVAWVDEFGTGGGVRFLDLPESARQQIKQWAETAPSVDLEHAAIPKRAAATETSSHESSLAQSKAMSRAPSRTETQAPAEEKLQVPPASADAGARQQISHRPGTALRVDLKREAILSRTRAAAVETRSWESSPAQSKVASRAPYRTESQAPAKEKPQVASASVDAGTDPSACAASEEYRSDESYAVLAAPEVSVDPWLKDEWRPKKPAPEPRPPRRWIPLIPGAIAASVVTLLLIAATVQYRHLREAQERGYWASQSMRPAPVVVSTVEPKPQPEPQAVHRGRSKGSLSEEGWASTPGAAGLRSVADTASRPTRRLKFEVAGSNNERRSVDSRGGPVVRLREWPLLARGQQEVPADKADDAQDTLTEIAAARKEERKPAADKGRVEQHENGRKLPQVTRIRSWNAENYSRVVIDIEGQVNYQAKRISKPDRIYFDLQKAELSSVLAGKTFETQGGFLKRIRAAQNHAGVVRIVLDTDHVKDYAAFLLPDPYRLVIDLYGASPLTMKAGAAELEKAAGPVPKAETSAKLNAGHAEVARSKPVEPAAAPLPITKSLPAGAANSAREAPAMTPPRAPRPSNNSQHSLTRVLGLKIGRIVIDPGHGGEDTGTIGPTGLMEKDLCLDVARRLGKLIQQYSPGAEVLYTREDDRFVPLESRTAIANQANADLFISIHANSSRDHTASGVETYYLNFAASPEAMEVASRENAFSHGSIHQLQDLIKTIARNEKIEESRALAAEIQDALTKGLQRVNRTSKNRGVRKAPFVVLVGANMPSVLSEISFLSNPSDERMLKKPEHRQRVAEGLYRGMERYLQSVNSLTYNRPRPSLGAP